MSDSLSNNSPPDPSPHWDDPRITAYVLGELPANEAADFARQIEADPALAAAVEQARDVTSQIESFYKTTAVPPLEGSRVDAIVRESEATSATTKKSSAWYRRSWVEWVVAASIIGILGGLSLPAVNSARQTARTTLESRAVGEPSYSMERGDSGMMMEEEAMPADVELLYQADASNDGASAKKMEKMDASEAEPILSKSVTAGRQAGEVESQLAPESPSMDSLSLKTPTEAAQARSQRERWGPGMGMDGMSMGDPSGGMMEGMGGLTDSERMDMAMGMDGGMGMGGMDPEYSHLPGEGMGEIAPARSAGQPIVGDFAVAPIPKTPGSAVAPRFRNAESLGKNIALPEPKTRQNPPADEGRGPGMSGDKFDPITENEFKRVGEHPLSTFSIDVDTASYSKVRSFLQRNQLPRPDAVRIEELINYFDYDYTPPTADDVAPFASAMAVAECPWNTDHRLVRVGIQAKDIDRKERPQCNLVFLIDTSGSMKRSNKLPLVIEGMKVLLDQLNQDDRVALVVYAGSSGLVLDSTPVNQKRKIVRALSALSAGGSTNGGAGLQLAYQTAREHFIDNGVNRVILCSDGDFNVGMTGTDQLVAEAARQAKSGIELTALGFGMGNHNDAMMERISNDGEGNYAFVDTIAEAKKVLSDQLSGTLFTVAKDVKIQVEFNPAVVSAYRLIGYENRILAKEDFNDDTKDAGEIGAGHRVTALYEIAPTGKLPASIAPNVDPLKYQTGSESPGSESPPDETTPAPVGSTKAGNTDEILTLKIRHKPPQGDVSEKIEIPLANEDQPFDKVDNDFRFAAAVAGFGMQLRNSKHAGTWTLDNVIDVAANASGSDDHGLRAEFIELARTARRLTVND